MEHIGIKSSYYVPSDFGFWLLVNIAPEQLKRGNGKMVCENWPLSLSSSHVTSGQKKTQKESNNDRFFSSHSHKKATTIKVETQSSITT